MTESEDRLGLQLHLRNLITVIEALHPNLPPGGSIEACLLRAKTALKESESFKPVPDTAQRLELCLEFADNLISAPPPAPSVHVQYLETGKWHDARQRGWDGPGWYFWDENDGQYCHGPYATMERAHVELGMYGIYINKESDNANTDKTTA